MYVIYYIQKKVKNKYCFHLVIRKHIPSTMKSKVLGAACVLTI